MIIRFAIYFVKNNCEEDNEIGGEATTRSHCRKDKIGKKKEVKTCNFEVKAHKMK